MLEALGLPADTTDTDLIVAAATDLAQQVEALDPSKPSTVAAAAARNGMEVLDKGTADALRRDAQEGRRITAAAAHAKVEASVDDAIDKGKITASRRKHWVDVIGADPGMADVLAAVPNETAVPLTEIGLGGGGDSDEPVPWFY